MMDRLRQSSFFPAVLILFSAQMHAQDLLRISRIVMAQHVDFAPAAIYPEDAKSAGIEGTVALDVVISTAGRVEQVHVLTGPDKLRESAKLAVSKWTYKPYMIDDKPREIETNVLVEFSLQNGGTSRDATGDAVETVTDARVAPAASAVPANGIAKAGPVRVSSGVMAGQILHREAVVYPFQARADHVSGAVIMHAIISKIGTIEELQVISGDERLRQAATDAVSKWTYKPFTLRGEPVAVETTITVSFNFGTHPSLPPVIPNNNGSSAPPIGSGGFGPH